MHDNPITLLVPEDCHLDRLDKFLAHQLPQYSRMYLQSLIEAGHVSKIVDANSQATLKASHKVEEHETWQIRIPQPQPLILEAEKLPLDIVFEDADLLVVNKPSGMLTHPSGKTQHGTLVNALLYHCQGQLSGINGVERPGIVHRLDKETSGLLMVAKTDAAHRHLQQQLQARTAKRHYWAIAQGIMPQKTGYIDAPIDRNPKNRDKMAVVSGGRHAVTHWTVLETAGSKFSLLQLQLETGRTHQIRVHLAHIHHPIFGDPLYGTNLHQQLRYTLDGQALQAFKLCIVHPITQAPLTFEIPMEAQLAEAWAFCKHYAEQG